MSLYSAPTKIGLMLTSRWCVSMASEKDTGVKHTHIGVGGLGHSFQKGPTDAIGTFDLTLNNIVIDSVIRIEIASTGALVELRTADATTEVFSLPAYSGGNVNNDLRIKVRKGTAAPKYLPFSTLATASVGAGSVYIAQVADTIA